MYKRQTLLRAYSGLPRAYLANEQIIGLHCFRPTRAYLGPTLPTSKSLDYIASGLLGPTSGLPCQRANHWITAVAIRALQSLLLQSLLCNLFYAIFAMQSLLCNLSYAIFAMQSLLAYLGPTFANQPIPFEKSG